MEITFSPTGDRVRWTQSPTLYRVAVKAGLYRKAVQVYHIPIPGDIIIMVVFFFCVWGWGGGGGGGIKFNCTDSANRFVTFIKVTH